MTTSGSTKGGSADPEICAHWDWCPYCRNGLDTGLECDQCGADLMPVQKALEELQRLRLALEPAAQYRFPRNPDPKSGWTIDPEFIHNLDNSIKARPDPWDVGMEGVEEVLLALERLSEAKVTERSARRDVETGREMAGSGNGQPPTKAGCSVPPAGWHCTREAGHDGPCAAVPV